MKFRHLFLGLLACSMITACTDNGLEENGGKQQNSGKPAYLTIAFSTNGANTRADANTGDSDGDAEDSGHKNDGTAVEKEVKRVLVIANPQGGSVGFAKLYTETDKVKDKTNLWVGAESVDAASTGLAPIELAVGKYSILVVVNPANEIMKQGFTSTNDLAEVQELYAKVSQEQYTPGMEIFKGDYGTNAATAADFPGFMMTNKADGDITLTEVNTPDNPANLTVAVERTLSKITYREAKANNKYEVQIASSAQAVTVEGAIDQGAENYVKVTFNKATDKAGKVVYALYGAVSGDDETVVFKGAYKQTEKEVEVAGAKLLLYTALVPKAGDEYNDENTQYKVDDESKPEESLELEQDIIGNETVVVTIEGYALVNLSKDVNYIRHTVNGSDNAGTPFGTLNGTNFLWTPNWQAKNAVTFDDNGAVTGSNPFNATTWFHNTLADVSTESKALTIEGTGDAKKFKNGTEDATYYKLMSTLHNQTAGTDVTGGNHSNTTPEANPAIGKVMAYCLENSTDIEHQVHGLSTGISFVATVAKEDGTAIDAMYQYGNHTYLSLAAIQKAYGASHFAAGFQALVDKEKADPTTITKTELEQFNIVKYESNVCYYYTTEIKHFDNGDASTLGNMEYAIMRNNIYSLSIKDINRIGDPSVDPTPGTPNESGKAALLLQVEIEPWIVRYNDMEF